jgi:hypothetical protein
MEKRPELSVRSEYEIELRVEPKQILFHDLGADKVRVQVTVNNDSAHRSEPTVMRLESAPLGAFVRWQPLSKLLVPALEPGESRDLSTEARRPRPTPLGDFNRVPPKKLLTAISSPGQSSPQSGDRFGAIVNLLRRGQADRRSGRDSARSPMLAPDLWDLFGQGQPHWAGNINVFVGVRPVERHFAKALRVYPGRTNLAMFVVGTPGRSDGFSFELTGLALDWKAALYDVTNHRNLMAGPSDAPIEETQWVESNGTLLVMLATRPPADCATGNVEVHVTRRSCATTAIVEFNLDPTAQGTGCYFV